MTLDGMKQVVARGLAAVGAHDAGANLAAGTNEATRAAVEQLLVRGLRKLYAAHRQGAAQADENSRLATDPDLKAQLQTGTKVNLDQRARLEDVFRAIGRPPEESLDEAMQGIIADNKAANAELTDPLALDLLCVDSGQIAAHFYIARYGTLRSYAEVLGHADAARLLKQTLDETESFDALCTGLAHRIVVRSA